MPCVAFMFTSGDTHRMLQPDVHECHLANLCFPEPTHESFGTSFIQVLNTRRVRRKPSNLVAKTESIQF